MPYVGNRRRLGRYSAAPAAAHRTRTVRASSEDSGTEKERGQPGGCPLLPRTVAASAVTRSSREHALPGDARDPPARDPPYEVRSRSPPLRRFLERVDQHLQHLRVLLIGGRERLPVFVLRDFRSAPIAVERETSSGDVRGVERLI